MNTISQLHRMAQQAINERDYVNGHRYCVEVIQQNPQHADSYFLLAMINVEIGQINKAIQLIHRAIEFTTSSEYFAHLCKCYALQGNMTAALKYAELVPVSQVGSALTLDTLGVALSRIGAHQKALMYFEKALSMKPKNPAFYYNYAVSSKFAGLFPQARQAFEQAIALKPNYYQAHFALSDMGQISAQHNHIARLESLMAQIDHPDAGLHIGHALAKEYEALARNDAAFTVLQQVKASKLSKIDYRHADDQALFSASKQWPSSSTNHLSACYDDSPIFVIGMPRSGTTLVERILSNHSQVDSCGELQDFGVAVKELVNTASNKVLDVATLQAAQSLNMRDLGERYIERTKAVRGDAKRFVDKLPFNFFYISLIKQALPKAKIVLVQRNPMDTCIGNYRQLFSINSPYYAYAYDLMNIGRFYAEFYKLVQFWQKQSIDNFFVLNYEQLARQPEQQIQQLLTFCDLDWQAQCVQVENNQAPVSTASKMQVREPINQSSIGRWRKYGELTLPLQQYFAQQGIPIE